MFRNYFKIACRNVIKHKGFSAINITGLAIGLAACWIILLYVADEYSYDQFNENADRICRLAQHARWGENDLHEVPVSAPFAPAMKAAFPEIQEATRILAEGGGVIHYQDRSIKADDIIFSDKNIFQVFSFPFLVGDPATALQAPESIVIDELLAKKLFGSAANAINQTIYFENNFPNKVTGVIQPVPQNSHLRFSAIRSLPADYTGGWQNFNVYTYLLLKPGASFNQLQGKLPAFVAGSIKQNMKVDDYRLELQTLRSIHLHSDLQFEISPNGSISRVYLMMAIALLILVIAIINYITLSTARSVTRVKEVGIRKIVGSGKGQLTSMFVTESVLIAMIAAILAILVIQLSMPAFNYLADKQLTIWRFGKLETLSVVGVFALMIGMITGIYPSLFLAGFKTMPALKGQMGNLSTNILFRKSLVVFQFVITIMMIGGSMVIYLQLQYVSSKDLGFNKSQLLSFHIDNKKVRAQTDALKAELLQQPAIEAASVAGNPIGNNDLGGSGYVFEKEKGDFNATTTIAQELMVDDDFVPAMEIKMSAGRNFSAGDPNDKFGSVMINETLQKKLGWINPIGKRMKYRTDDKGTMAERLVVGVVKDFHTYSLQHKVEPLVMLMPPDANQGDNLYVKIAKGRISEGLKQLESIYAHFDKVNKPDYHFLEANFNKQYNNEKRQGQVTLIFALLAILIACLGLFGLAAFTAEQKTKEIGIRKVLGASVMGIVQMLSAEFVKLVLIAAFIALPIAAIALHEWLEGFAYHITISWWILLMPAILALIIAVMTVSFQAIKSAIANPVKSLRTE